MAMNPTTLAADMKDGLGQGGPNTSEVQGMARAVIDEFSQLSVVSFVPGTVNGVAPPSGGPLTGGTAVGGTILGPSGTTLAARFQTEMSKPFITPQLQAMATGIASHFLTAVVTFALVTGVCSNTPVSPGVLTGEASGGLISGMDALVMAALIAPSLGGPPTPELIGLCGAIVDHVQTAAEVSFLTGSVTGTCSAGGGPLIAGAAIGGTVA